MTRFARYAAALIAIVGILDRAGAASAAAARLSIEPPELQFTTADERAQLLVTLHTADGRTLDLTRSATYTLANPALARIEQGYLAPLADGETTITIVGQDESGARLTASAALRVKNAAADPPIHFSRDVVPLFSKFSCNSGGCHGKLAGQNGFRLSLFGFDPSLDYDTLVKEARGRRLFPAAPDQSLVLLKATGTIPHGGGARFDVGSEPYQVLHRWIKQGAPADHGKPVTLTKIRVSPQELVTTRHAAQQLRVIAEYSDGTTRDVTRVAEYRCQANDLMQVDMNGLVTTLDRGGEGTILVRYSGGIEIARFSIPFSQGVPEAAFAAFQPANYIDEATLQKWHTLGVAPSAVAGDEEFLRRATLDATGCLPSPDEVRAFLADARPDKRARCIDRLLERPEYVDYWTLKLADLLQNRKERDHDVRGVKGVRDLHYWLREQVAKNRPWNELARDVLTVRGDSFEHPAVGYYVVTIGESHEPDKSDIPASVAQSFLGTRILCAKCHNHPTEKYTQDDYYHFAAFFSRVDLKRESPEKGPTRLVNDVKRALGSNQPRTGERLNPQPLDRTPTTLANDADPREALAKWVTAPENAFFSGAIVNRLWKHFLGIGLVEPVDDLRATNPPTNPQLWEALSRDLVEHQYDLKHLMRTIMNSRTYQLSANTTPENEHDARFYSHFYVRRLPAEVLADALATATGVPERFSGYPEGMRAVQLPDPSLNSYFLGLFGRSERTTACACERRDDVTVRQLLHMQNGDAVIQKIHDMHGRLAQMLDAKRPSSEMIDELFLAALGRHPAADERTAVEQSLAQAGDQQMDFFQDLFWALLNTKEFTFNH
ncbi:MAG TPA: DUF1553 domain-containing protein [Pirellulales bacterium]|jgi:hypothetical protein|nr:DUF1553 domain-containing protein [Pirellulales bacterium]